MLKKINSTVTFLAVLSSLGMACGSTDDSQGPQEADSLSASSSINGANIPVVAQIVDAGANAWTVSAGVI